MLDPINRDDLTRETAVDASRRRLVMRVHRVSVLGLAVEFVALGERFRGQPHIEKSASRRLGPGRIGQRIETQHWHARHASTPAAMIASPAPSLIAPAAICTALSEEPHQRLIVPPPTQSGRPASWPTIRPRLSSCSPSGKAHPENQVLDFRGIKFCPGDQGFYDRRRKIVGAGSSQRPFIGLGEGRARVIDDEYAGHHMVPWRISIPPGGRKETNVVSILLESEPGDIKTEGRNPIPPTRQWNRPAPSAKCAARKSGRR